MIAYNNHWLDNLFIHRELQKALRHKCISPQEAQAVRERYPVGFYSPNLFIRIGFFLLTVVIGVFGFGLLALLFMDSIEHNWNGLLVFMSLLAYGALELLVKSKHLFKAGADDALLWISAAFFITGISDILHLSYTADALLVFMVTLFLALRFTNALMAAAAVLSLLALVFLLYTKLGAFAKASTPFLLILVCALLYMGVQKAVPQPRWKRYDSSLAMIPVVLLVCGYLAGNFYAVRETSNSMFNLGLQEGESIPGGWFFWCWTLLVPLAYIARGIQKKDTIFLRTGLLLVGVLVFTVRYYYHLLPVETAMVAAGLLLTGMAWALLHYLSIPRYGFTGDEATDPHWMDKLQVEALVIAETFQPGQPAAPAPDKGFEFGGGSGSGGGASGGF